MRANQEEDNVGPEKRNGRIRHKWGFGMSPISENMMRRYSQAVDTILLLLEGKIQIGEVRPEAVSELKWMFNRCIRKDQWDWYNVYKRFGEPPIVIMRKVVNGLSEFRGYLVTCDYVNATNVLSSLNELKISQLLHRFVTEPEENCYEGDGWIYLLSNKIDPTVLKIGMTTRSVVQRVKEINAVTGVVYPYSVWSLYKVKDPAKAEKDIFRILSEYRIRDDREFFQVDHKVATRIIEDFLNAEGLILMKSQVKEEL